jgi:membrane associated rhomboid family serine protease
MTEPSVENPPSLPDEPQREPVFNIPPIVLVLIGACVIVYAVQEYVLDLNQQMAMLVRAAFIPVRYSGQYDLDIYAFTTPFTYAFLHGSLAHLAINMIWLAAFGSPLANRLGMLRFALFWVVTGLAAAGLHWAIYPLDHAPLVGASGAISGMMGAAARFGFNMERKSGRAAFTGPALPVSEVLRSRSVMTFLAVWMIVNLVTGLVGTGPGSSATIAWEAHIGGFLAGFFALPYFLGKAR